MSEERKLVIPGDLLGKGRAGHGTYEEDDNVFSRFVGLAEEKNGMYFVIPLSGIYDPKRGDGIIGKIQDVIFSKWIVEINSPYDAVLPLSEATEEFIDLTKTDLTKYFSYEDLIFAEVSSVTSNKNVQLSMKSRRCRKLKGGRLISVTPAKVPRIIGKGGSMVEMIKDLTGTQIVVGQNGLVWIRGDNYSIAAEAVTEIEKKSHLSGLTDQIRAMIEEKISKKGEHSGV
ncbi:MAG: KH domain-containing protein [Candidatus Aenigmarchaeota archaeon]|nr:KH domain-containing protein [Candidatus Aenigmarchaeota archaeon]